MRKLIVLCVLISLPVPQALACTQAQHTWLIDQITEIKNSLALDDNAPESSRSLEYPNKVARLHDLYHALQVCEDSFWEGGK